MELFIITFHKTGCSDVIFYVLSVLVAVCLKSLVSLAGADQVGQWLAEGILHVVTDLYLFLI